MGVLKCNPSRNVKAIKIDLDLPALKPHHTRDMKDVYNYPLSENAEDIIEGG